MPAASPRAGLLMQEARWATLESKRDAWHAAGFKDKDFDRAAHRAGLIPGMGAGHRGGSTSLAPGAMAAGD